MVAENFKFLARYHGDKQEVLAQMLRVSQSTISEYMNGKKNIPIDVLNKIAFRYNMSTDDLLTRDLSSEYDSPQTINLENAMNFGNKMYPMLTSDVADQNDDFNCALKMLQDALCVENLEELINRVNDMECAIALFQKAWTDTKTYVALSNSLTAILLSYSFYSQNGLEIGQQIMNKGSMDSREIRASFLCDPRKPKAGNKYALQQKGFFEKYDDLVYSNIKELKSNTHFSELGDYYLALCNLIGFTEDFIEYEESFQTGLNMLLQLCKLKNKYAEEFMETLSLVS